MLHILKDMIMLKIYSKQLIIKGDFIKMSTLKNRVILINNRKTSMRLALEEWTALDDICRREGLKRKKLLEMIEAKKSPDLGLTCCVRLFTTAYMHQLAKLAGQGTFSDKRSKVMCRVFDMIS